jgi:hypothetical protein
MSHSPYFKGFKPIIKKQVSLLIIRKETTFTREMITTPLDYTSKKKLVSMINKLDQNASPIEIIETENLMKEVHEALP